MGYRELAQSKARMAFKLIGNLARQVTLVQSDSSTFNFSSETAVTSAAKTSSVKAVFTSKGRERGEGNTIRGELLMLSEDFDDLTVYDKVIIEGVTWNIVPPYVDDEYTVVVNVSREQGGS